MALNEKEIKELKAIINGVRENFKENDFMLHSNGFVNTIIAKNDLKNGDRTKIYNYLLDTIDEDTYESIYVSDDVNYRFDSNIDVLEEYTETKFREY